MFISFDLGWQSFVADRLFFKHPFQMFDSLTDTAVPHCVKPHFVISSVPGGDARAAALHFSTLSCSTYFGL